MARQMHLVGYLTAGPTWHCNGSWRHEDSDGIRALDPSRYEHVARVLEAGKFDGLFFVDLLYMSETHRASIAPHLRSPGQMWLLEPLQLLTAIARVTKHIGLSATMSTTLYPAYHIARSFASLDHISGGRAAWNIVTSFSNKEAQNFGLEELMDRSIRYDYADEVVEACMKLWGSWEPDALILDREKGIFADPEKVHHANYAGRWVKTRGPLQVPHTPQGHPVLMQAGASDRGREFAARWAEVIFTLQHSKDEMKEFRKDIKERVVKAGRSPAECMILPSVDVIIGETESIAREQADYLVSLVDAEAGVAGISSLSGTDLSGYPLDKPLEQMEINQGSRGIFDLILTGSRKKNLTLREAGRQYGINQLTPQLVGTPEMISDELEDLFVSEACDGFVVCPSVSPSGYEQFVQSVVPRLQKRGIYRTEYAGRTFRDNLRSGNS